MRRILFLIAFMFVTIAYSQGGTLMDAIKLRGEVTTTVRDSFTVPTGQTWIVFNVTTQQLEIAGDDENWIPVGGDLDQTLSISGSNLTISGGNTVSLPSTGGAADNLGNHTATTTLDLADFDIENVDELDVNIINALTNIVTASIEAASITSSSLSGVGNRMVIASDTGVLSTQAIPSSSTDDQEADEVVFDNIGSYPTLSNEGTQLSSNDVEGALKELFVRKGSSLSLSGNNLILETQNGGEQLSSVDLSVLSGSTYTAGDGLTLTGSEFSVDNPLTNGNKGDITVLDDGATFTINQESIESGMIINGQITPNKLDSDNSTTANYIVGLNDSGNGFEYIDPSIFGGGTDDQNASEVPITDAGGYFTSTEVEGALQELGSGTANNNFGIVAEGSETVSGAAGFKTIVVNHGLGYTPSNTKIQIQNFELASSAEYISSVNSTSFSITTGANAGAVIAWRIFGTGTITGQTADEVAYDNTTSGLTSTDVQDAIDELASGGISDSGQAMSTQTKTDATETFDNNDVTVGGTAGNKRILTKLSGTNEITLDGTITNYNQPFLLYHDSGVGSTTIKKGVGTTFKVADLGILADDGLTFDNYGNMTVIALVNNEYLISCSSCDPYTEATTGYSESNSMSPNEVNATTGIPAVTGVNITSDNTYAYNGTYSIKIENTTGSAISVFPPLPNVSNTDVVSLEMYTYRLSGGSGNGFVHLDDAQGWNVDNSSTIGALSSVTDAWQFHDVSATATQDNPNLRLTVPANTTIWFDYIIY